MELGSRFSISADGAGFSVLHLSRWSCVLGSPSQLMELGSRFSISADGAGFSVLQLSRCNWVIGSLVTVNVHYVGNAFLSLISAT